MPFNAALVNPINQSLPFPTDRCPCFPPSFQTVASQPLGLRLPFFQASRVSISIVYSILALFACLTIISPLLPSATAADVSRLGRSPYFPDKTCTLYLEARNTEQMPRTLQKGYVLHFCTSPEIALPANSCHVQWTNFFPSSFFLTN